MEGKDDRKRRIQESEIRMDLKELKICPQFSTKRSQELQGRNKRFQEKSHAKSQRTSTNHIRKRKFIRFLPLSASLGFIIFITAEYLHIIPLVGPFHRFTHLLLHSGKVVMIFCFMY